MTSRFQKCQSLVKFDALRLQIKLPEKISVRKLRCGSSHLLGLVRKQASVGGRTMIEDMFVRTRTPGALVGMIWFYDVQGNIAVVVQMVVVVARRTALS